VEIAKKGTYFTIQKGGQVKEKKEDGNVGGGRGKKAGVGISMGAKGQHLLGGRGM